ncbi:MAG: acyloxyacyl hydrolase [Cytophagales bacterium]|nr:MAG: acyloxyacyl hydrolase [Cytophagales bacterium]
MFSALVISTLLQTPSPDSVQRQVGVQVHTGFIIPHAPDLEPFAQNRPVAIELNYSRMALTRVAYERCNCVARVGAYLNYAAFNNPTELGRTIGAGGFFEPLIRPRGRLFGSVRATAGLACLTRIYDAQTNPRNTFFGSPISGLLALSAGVHYRMSPHWQVSAWGHYNHISNGGIRQPNRGMNYPTAGLGLTYIPRALPLPDPTGWPRPRLSNRFTARLSAFGSVRTLPQTATLPEQAGWSWGLTTTAGYRLSRFHALTGGLEFVDDGYLRLQLQREGLSDNYRQLGLLGGYELWLGRYVFATHVGYNVLQPTALLGSPVFQRYQLLYTFRNRYQLGIGLRAKLNVAEGFDVRAGVKF